MQTGIVLALLGGILGLIGPLLLPFVTVLEEEANIPGYKTVPGILGIALAIAALAVVSIVARRRRLQGLGGLLGLFALGELGLMAWTWADVWSLVPCEESGLALCEPDTGLLVAETLVRLDWGVGACLLGAVLLFIGGLVVLLAHPEFGGNERYLRVRMGWQGSTLVESVAFRRRVVSIGESDGATLQLPAGGIGHHLLLVPLDNDDEAWRLTAPAIGELEVFGRGGSRTLRAGEQIDVRRGDVGMLHLGDDLFVSFDFMAAETAVLGGAPQGVWELLTPLVAVTTLALMVLLASALSSRRGDRHGFDEDVATHQSELIEVAIAEPLPEPEPEPAELEPGPELQPAKKMDGDEGKFGDLMQTREQPTKVPPKEAPPVENLDVRKLGVVAALEQAVADPGAIGAILAGPTNELESKLAVASAGEGVELQLGPGTGTGWRFTGSGGGGQGESGKLRGTSDTIDVGTDVGRKARVSTGQKRRVAVKDIGPVAAAKTGEYCDRGDIIKQVKLRAAALRSCYEQALLSQPTLAGKIDAQWTVDSQGRATAAKIASSTLNNASVGDCVLRTIARLRFKVPEAGVCVVRWPFVFSAGG